MLPTECRLVYKIRQRRFMNRAVRFTGWNRLKAGLKQIAFSWSLHRYVKSKISESSGNILNVSIAKHITKRQHNVNLIATFWIGYVTNSNNDHWIIHSVIGVGITDARLGSRSSCFNRLSVLDPFTKLWQPSERTNCQNKSQAVTKASCDCKVVYRLFKKKKLTLTEWMK